MNVLVPNLDPFKQLAVPGATFLTYGRGTTEWPDAEGLVLWGLPRADRLAVFKNPALRWVLTLTAGVDHVLRDLPEHVKLYNAHRLHDEAVAQHAVASILSAARGLHRARDAQRDHAWVRHPDLWTLTGKHVVIWGYGHIGQRMAQLLAPFGAPVTGLRSGSTPAEVSGALATADVLVLLLPATSETRGIMDAARFGQLKRGAWLANYGRGDLVVTQDLLAALHAGQLGGAILDVTDPEPLPAESPLWSMENVLITPHVASTTQDVLDRAGAFTESFVAALQRGEDLGNRVDRAKGY